MRRRRRLEDNERISLFPFLAVLICTMGALLVLLVVISERAQAKAKAQAATIAETNEADQQATQAALEALQNRLQQITQRRQQIADLLGERRDVLSHVENHIRRLRDNLIRLRQSMEELETTKLREKTDLSRLQAELTRLENQIIESEKLLKESLAEAASAKPSYAIIPPTSINQTQRRPIYLECREETIVLQPEGIVLTESDFKEPLELANPLAAGLRAAADFYARENPGATARAYPLLIVRPSSIQAYYAARSAMKAWDSEFGYERNSEDWEVEFPMPDPRLARIVTDAIEVERRRQRLVQQAGGGLGGRGHAGGTGGDATSERYSGSRYADPRYSGSTYANGAARGGPGSDAANTDPSPYEPGFGRFIPAKRKSSESGEEKFGGGPGSNSPSSTDRRRNESQSTQQASEGGTNNRQSPSAAGGVPNGPNQFGSTTQTAQGAANGQPAMTSLAETRGNDWALPGAGKGLIAITRPVRVECSADRLVIVPSDRHTQWQTIGVPGATEDAVEKFVSAVWEHMKGWGIAGRGLYWKPILNVYVHPGGEQRANELAALLNDSGMEINLKRP